MRIAYGRCPNFNLNLNYPFNNTIGMLINPDNLILAC